MRITLRIFIVIIYSSASNPFYAQDILNTVYIKKHVPDRSCECLKKVASDEQNPVVWKEVVDENSNRRRRSDTLSYLDYIYMDTGRSSHRKVIEYAYLKSPDVVWAQKVRRLIDGKERFNYPLFVSGKYSISLWQIVAETMKNSPGKITLYENSNSPDSIPKYAEIFSRSLTAITDSTYWDKQIIEWEILEEWYFDKQRSVLDVRIIGISPRLSITDDSGNRTGSENLFWIYYPQFCEVLRNYKVYWPNNTETFAELFRKRKFWSLILHKTKIYDSIDQQFLKTLVPEIEPLDWR